MPPVIPADLSGLSLDELNDLYRQCQEFAAANGETAPIADLTTAVEGAETLQAEIAARGDAEPPPDPAEDAAARAALLARIPVAEPASEGEPEPSDASADAVAAALSRFATELVQRLAAVPAAVPAPTPLTAAGAPLRGELVEGLPPLSRIGRSSLTVIERPAPIRGELTITAGAEVDGFRAGQELNGLEDVDRALLARLRNLTPVRGATDGEKVVVASVRSELPDGRFLREGHDADNRRKLAEVTALVAAGGLCAPVTPYYDFLVLAGAQRPVRDALTGYGATRGGITFLPSLQWTAAGNQTRTVTDGATTNTSTTVTSASAAFLPSDVGAAISGNGIPAGAYIVVVTNATTVTISAAATATATGVTVTIVRYGASRVVTNAQDASSLNGTAAQIVAGSKPCFHVTCPSPETVYVQAVTNCIEIDNFYARAYPEGVSGWTQMALATWARTAETALLDAISAKSTQVTAAAPSAGMGASRAIPAQLIKAAAYYRSRNRMPLNATIEVLLPYWLPALEDCDQIFGSLFDADYYRLAVEMEMTLADNNIAVSWYMDSGTGKGQLINSGAQQGASTLVTFPTTVVSYMFAPGSFLFLDGGELNFGLIRDSVLNAQNNYRVFSESFEAVAFVGMEALELTHQTVVASGSGSASVTGPTAF